MRKVECRQHERIVCLTRHWATRGYGETAERGVRDVLSALEVKPTVLVLGGICTLVSLDHGYFDIPRGMRALTFRIENGIEKVGPYLAALTRERAGSVLASFPSALATRTA